MRRFVCADCGHTFEVAYGTGTSGAQMTCPKCGSRNVHRAPDDREEDEASTLAEVAGRQGRVERRRD